MKVRQMMNPAVVTVEPDESLARVKEIFDRVRFHHLLVVEKRRLVGVLSDRDLLKVMSPNLGTPAETDRDVAPLRKRVHQIMTRNPVIVDASSSVHEAIALFNQYQVSCLPVTDAVGRPVGVLSWRDILRVLGQAKTSPGGDS